MRIASRYFIIAVLAVSGGAFRLAHKRDVAKVEADIATISAQVTTLDNDVNAFPASGGSLVAALGIHVVATQLISSLNTGAGDVNAVPLPVSESDASTILNDVEAFEPVIINALAAIITKKPAFQSLPLGGVPAIVKADLNSLNVSTVAFGTALIAAAPADQKANAIAIKAAIDAAFSKAIAAYADV